MRELLHELATACLAEEASEAMVAWLAKELVVNMDLITAGAHWRVATEQERGYVAVRLGLVPPEDCGWPLPERLGARYDAALNAVAGLIGEPKEDGNA